MLHQHAELEVDMQDRLQFSMCIQHAESWIQSLSTILSKSSTAGSGFKKLLLKKESKGPFTRYDFKDPILGSENWNQAFIRSDFKVPFL